MKIIECEQRSSAWYSARIGIPTSSNFDKIVTTKGEPSKQRTKYLYQLAGEKIIGKAEETYQSHAMQVGVEREAEARRLYEMIYDVDVQEVGFCLAEGFGASPDALVGADGSLEIKCPNLATYVEYLLKRTLPTAYFQQVQGQLLVTGRNWVDFMSYYPGMKPFIKRVYRDEAFLMKLKVEIRMFCNELNSLINRLK